MPREFMVEYASGVAEAERLIAAEAKAVSGYTSQALSLTDPKGWVSDGRIAAGERVTLSAVIGLSATWACVNFWAGNIAALPLTVYRPGPDGVSVEDKRHRLYWVLHSSPNYDQSAFDFWEFIVASLELRGNAYAAIDKRSDGYIRSLTPIRPDLMTVERRQDGSILYTWTDESGSERRSQQEDILHIRGPFGGPLGGASPLSVLRQTFGTALATEKAAGGTFANGLRPSGVLNKDGVLTPEQREKLEGLLQEKYRGALNSGRPLLLDNGLSWSSINLNPDDAQMLESRQFGIEEIARVFEVDPHLIGHVHGNTQLGSSITDQTLSLLKFKMRKRLKRIEGALEKQLLTRADRDAGVTIEFNVEGFLRADSKGRAEYYDIMKQFMTKNEIRALEGLPPVEGGDVLMAQMQDVPLSDALKGQNQ